MYIFFKNTKENKSPQKEGLGPRILSREEYYFYLL
jgi:hypothetical protein